MHLPTKDWSCYPKEEEVILLPYFALKVRKAMYSVPFKDGNKTGKHYFIEVE